MKAGADSTLKDMAGEITVALVEDDSVVRGSLARLIGESKGFSCVAEFATGEEALKRLPGLKPQVVLMDVNLPGMSGIACTHRLKQLLPQTQVVMLTMYDDSDHIFRALQAGATGYLLKRAETEEVLEAIRDAMVGGSPMSSQIARKVVQSFREPVPEKELAINLTDREDQILSYLSKGYANKESADVLSISLHTVRTHLRNTYDKLHVRSRTQAMAKYLQ